jgi:cytochrome c oxidase subunit 2
MSVGAVALTLSLSACSTTDWEKAFGFGWPLGITTQSHAVRGLWTWSIIAALVVGALVWGLIFWACIAYRRRDAELPRQTKYNLPIEALYTVSVTAFRWNWQFSYDQVRDPRTNQAVYTVGTSNEIPVLVVPVNENVRFRVSSNDVVHSFWIPDTLFKRDVFPAPTKNQNNEFQLRPEAEGSYVGRCAELCGTYHAEMNFETRVVSASDYRRYLQALASFGNSDPDRQAKALSAIGQPAHATTTHPFDTSRTGRAPSEGQQTNN